MPKASTQGAIVALQALDGKELDTVLTLSRVYKLSSIYVVGDIPGFDDANVQTSLRGMFRKIRTVPLTGQDEGRAAVDEYLRLLPKQLFFF
jgi:hypothetical protein